MNKPYTESCDQNKIPIFSVIAPIFSSLSSVFEIGSGTGQHAVYFARKMPHLTWHTSDCSAYIEGINSWLTESKLSNLIPPVELNVSTSMWPSITVDAVFTANTVHIMHQDDVLNLVTGVAKLLNKKGSFVIYGPFNYNGGYTSDSNARFDSWLKERDPLSGIKHFEDIKKLAEENAMELVRDYEMPANNRILHFRKT